MTASDSTTIEATSGPYFNSPQNDTAGVNFGFFNPLTVTAGQYSSSQSSAPGDIKVGDTGVLFFITFGGPVTISSVQDSLGNEWAPLTPGLNYIGDNQFWAFAAPMQTAVAIGDTFTITVNVDGTFDAIERAFINVGGISGIDQVAYATYPENTVTALVAGPITTAQPDGLLSAAIADVNDFGFGAVAPPSSYIPAIKNGVEGWVLLPAFFTGYPNAAPTVPPGTYSATWPTLPAGTTGGAVALISFIAR